MQVESGADPPQIALDANGLVPCVTQDWATGEVLTLAYMNREALERTLESGEMHFWSRSRQELWHKGETSGNVQRLRSLRYDCDADALLALVEPHGPCLPHRRAHLLSPADRRRRRSPRTRRCPRSRARSPRAAATCRRAATRRELFRAGQRPDRREGRGGGRGGRARGPGGDRRARCAPRRPTCCTTSASSLEARGLTYADALDELTQPHEADERRRRDSSLPVTPSLDEAHALARDYNVIPLRHTFIDDIETPVSAFLKLRGRGPAFLLESAEQGQRFGR